jgi:hypothetical protein
MIARVALTGSHFSPPRVSSDIAKPLPDPAGMMPNGIVPTALASWRCQHEHKLHRDEPSEAHDAR